MATENTLLIKGHILLGSGLLSLVGRMIHFSYRGCAYLEGPLSDVLL